MLENFTEQLRHLLTHWMNWIILIGFVTFLLYLKILVKDYEKLDRRLQSQNFDGRDTLLRRKFLTIPQGISADDWYKLHKRKIVNSYQIIRNITIIYLISVVLTYISFSYFPPIYLKIHGSNTLGSGLVPALAEEFLKEELKADETRTDPQEQVEKVVTGRGNFQRFAIEIHAHGSETAFSCIEQNKCDIGMSSREIKKPERDKIQALKLIDTSSRDFENPIALDAIAVIVNKNNPIKELNLEKIAKIFSGDIKDWKDITGEKTGKISVYARDKNSGTYSMFSEAVLEKYNLKISSAANLLEDSTQLSNLVAKNIQAVGFISRKYIGKAQPIRIFDINTTPLLPEECPILKEEYLLSRRVFLYSPEWWNLSNNYQRYKKSRDFIKFTLSSKGQEIVEKEGFIPVGNLSQSINNCSDRSQFSAFNSSSNERNSYECQDYSECTKGARRIPLSLMFQINSNELDSKANQDIERIVKLLNTPEFKDKGIMIFGFTDNTGKPEQDFFLSTQRAEHVANILKNRRLKPNIVRGFGQQHQFAPNDSEGGRIWNRRVEIWLR